MVKIENIVRDGNIVTMDCYEEGDKNRGHHVIFNIDTFEILNGVICDIYVRQSIWRLRKIFDSEKELPNEAVSVWY